MDRNATVYRKKKGCQSEWVAVPTLFIAREQKKGIIKTSLLCGHSRVKVFLAKTTIYYFAVILVCLFYIFLLKLINVKGLSLQVIDNEHSAIYFLRCSSIGFSYCIMLSTLLLSVSIIFKNPSVTVVSGIILFCIDFFMQATDDAAVMTSFILTVTLTTIIAYAVSLIVFYKRDYK